MSALERSTSALEVHTTGSSVWVRDAQEGWTKGRVLAVSGASLTVETESGAKLTAQAADCPLQNFDTRGVEVRRTPSPASAGPTSAQAGLGGSQSVLLCAAPHALHRLGESHCAVRALAASGVAERQFGRSPRHRSSRPLLRVQASRVARSQP